MNLEGIIAIAGKPGLFKVVSQGKNTVIIESLVEKKRMPITARYQVNTLEDIGIYTYEETKPLSEIFDAIAKKENKKQCISHKSSKEELVAYFKEILPEFDEDRVYISDIKKVIQWYNNMETAGLIELPKPEKNTKKKKASIKK